MRYNLKSILNEEAVFKISPKAKVSGCSLLESNSNADIPVRDFPLSAGIFQLKIVRLMLPNIVRKLGNLFPLPLTYILTQPNEDKPF